METGRKIHATVRMDLWYYWTFFLGHFFSFNNICLALMISVVFTIILIFVTSVKVFELYGLRMLVTGVLFYTVILQMFFLFYSMYGNWNRGVEEIEYCFADDGVQCKTKNFETRLKWSYFRRVRETSSFFKITPKLGNYILVPKLAFNSLENILELRELFREKLGREAYLKGQTQNQE